MEIGASSPPNHKELRNGMASHPSMNSWENKVEQMSVKLLDETHNSFGPIITNLLKLYEALPSPDVEKDCI